MIIIDRAKLEVVSRVTSIEECRELKVFDKLLDELVSSVIPGAGLAAIQIGISIRASILLTDKHLYRMVNPEIQDKSYPVIWPNEGCLSCPGTTYMTDRFSNIIIKWLDYESGAERRAATDGFEAVVLQHEVNHMDGILNYRMEHKYTEKIGRNSPCPICEKKGVSIKWKKCKEHNLGA